MPLAAMLPRSSARTMPRTNAQVWDYAVREGTAILTKHEDFAAWPDDHLAQNRELLAGRSRTVARIVIVLDRGVCRGGRKRH